MLRLGRTACRHKLCSGQFEVQLAPRVLMALVVLALTRGACGAGTPDLSCRVPLQQLEARLAIRANRPAMESVEDEVQAALAAEAAQLKAVSTQLHARVDAAGQQIAHLNSVSVALLQHIADKETALSLEEKVALMDGRKIVAVPPSPTVLSVSAV